MITCFLKGGLGNQLFQIFAIIAYGLENKFPFKFLYSETSPSCTLRYTYWNTFLKSLRFFTIKEVPTNMKMAKHPTFTFEPIPIMDGKNQNICIEGYFQSEKFFRNKKSEIFSLIQLGSQQKSCVQKHGFQNMENTISMHFRIGDYKHLSLVHPIIGVDYYINSLTYILSKNTTQNFRIIYCNEAEDNQLVEEWVNEILIIFPFLQFEKIPDHIEDWEQMLILSQCSHSIIANSSFSWFGAYFNTHNPTQIVCYPDEWFAGEAALTNDTKDLCPPSWKKIRTAQPC